MRTTLLTPTHQRGGVGEYLSRHTSDWLQPDQVEQRHLPEGLERLGIRADTNEDGSGEFAGWACIFDVRDSYGTTFRPGCFTAGGLQETPYPLLWMHSPMVPTGTFTAEERDIGLWIEGSWDPTPDGQASRTRAQTGSAPELSVGFVWLDDGGEGDEDSITSARLVETSQITLRMAAVPGAGFQDVREDGDLDEAERARLNAILTLAQLV